MVVVLLLPLVFAWRPFVSQVSYNAKNSAANLPHFFVEQHGFEIECTANEPRAGAITIRAQGLSEDQASVLRQYVEAHDGWLQPIRLEIVD